jgi:hypothetical protein
LGYPLGVNLLWVLELAGVTIQSQQLKWAKVAMVTDDPLWSIGSTSSVPVPRQRRSKNPLQLRITSHSPSGATGSARDDIGAIIGICSECQEALRLVLLPLREKAHHPYGVTALV